MEINNNEAERFLNSIGVELADKTFWGLLGCKLERIEQGKVCVTLETQQKHLNLLDIVHGGVTTTMMDTAMGIAAMVAFPGEKTVTANLNVHFVAPLQRGSKVITTAEVIHRSSRTVTTYSTTKNDEGLLCAVATGTFRII